MVVVSEEMVGLWGDRYRRRNCQVPFCTEHRERERTLVCFLLCQSEATRRVEFGLDCVEKHTHTSIHGSSEVQESFQLLSSTSFILFSSMLYLWGDGLWMGFLH
jgi:hypothetical protein